jgi:hypothetical protein
VFESWRIHDVDVSAWPPTTTTREGIQVTVAAPTPWGTTLLRVATDPDVRPYKFSTLEEPSQRRLDFPYEVSEASPTRDAVLVFPPRYVKVEHRERWVPMIVRPSGITPLDVPLASEKEVAGFATSFGDDSTLVIWDRKPYHWDGATVTALGGELATPDGHESVVAMPDGSIVGGFGRNLIRIDREGRQTKLLPIDNVMGVALGPEEALIVAEGDHPESDVLKVYWSGTREITHLEGALLGLEDKPALFYYDLTRRRLVVLAPTAWHAVEWATIAALPRVPLIEYTKRRAELVARRAKD